MALPNNQGQNVTPPILPLRCSQPYEIFSLATAITILCAKEMSESQLNTLINLLGLIQAGLSSVVTQMQICQGDDVQPPIL